MADEFTQADLEAYLDEGLTATEMAHVESLLRDDATLMRRLQAILERRDAGVHSLGEIWRRQRLTCPDRETLGNFLLGVLPPDQQDYLEFHLETIGCRYCQANRDDLQAKFGEQVAQSVTRQQRYFQSSAGYLRKSE